MRIDPRPSVHQTLTIDTTWLRSDRWEGKEGNVLFNDALNTFYFTVIWRRTCKRPLR